MLAPRRLVLNGRPTLAVWEGAQNGPSVIFLHGLARRGNDWNPLLASLTPGIHPFLLDWRGHGLSDRGGSYQVRDYAADLLEVLPFLTHHPVLLVGHSLGALVATEVARMAPERIAALVLEDPPSPGFISQLENTGYGDLFRVYCRLAGGKLPVQKVASQLAASEIRDAQGKMRPLGQMRDSVSLRYMADCLRHLDPGTVLTALAGTWFEGFHFGQALRQVRCPVLMLRGDPNFGGMLPQAEADLLFGPVSDLTRLDLAGVGHQIHGTATESMARAIWAFLATLG
jgi:pimeloyl-ACP methyl ester carboxylesterase